MSRLPIEGHNGWFKDTKSGFIDCANKSTYDQYMLSVKSEREKEEEIRTLQKDVSDLKSDMGDIKSLLLTLVQKNHDN
jgi:hypothetical protein